MEVLKFENGFKITYKGLDLISHSKERPLIYAGTGKADYKMYRGNFKISDYLVEKIALLDYEIKEEKNKVNIKLSRNNICYVNLCIEENNNLIVNFNEYSKDINRLWIRINAYCDEHVYGCGEQFSYFDLRGKNFPLFTTEQGVGRNKKTLITALADIYDDAGGDYYSTFYPQPTFVSSRKYFCHVDDSCYMNFDFTNENYHELEIWSVPEKIYFGAECNFKKLLGNLTELLGRQEVLPDWAIEGIWLGIQGGTDVVKGKVDRAIERGVKVTGVWCQDWEGKRITSFGKRLMWNWIWDKNLYPDLDKYIKELNEKGIRFLGYINPYLATDGSLYKEAAEKGYIVKRNDGSEYVIDAGEFYVGIVDLTNPYAFDWYKEVIKKYMIDFGLSGWMADFGEYLPVDVKLYNNVSGEKMHNLWPVLWAKVNREAIEESGKLGEAVFFMRSGYSGSGRYNLITWAGDQNVDYSLDDGLASVIVAALSLGMSGMGIHHSDIGGYTTLFEMKRSKELLLRWTDFAAFTPIMRTHEGNRPSDNWQFDSDEETLKHFERMTKIHYMLKPYIKEAIIENADYGIPVMRPLFLNYEEDKNLYDLKYEYMLGDDLIVAPVYESSKNTWKAYLPQDNWVHLWSNKEYDGGYIEVEAPIGYPPVFYKKNSKYEELLRISAGFRKEIYMKKEGIKIHDIKSLEFKKYGRIIEGYDFNEAIEYLENSTEIPIEGNIYVASDENLEKLQIKKMIEKVFYGDIDVQFGYCNGKNFKLNALEYHKSSEIDVAATDMILLLGDVRDIDNNSYETKNVEAFYIHRGTAIELYSTTLHFSPIKVYEDGFKCIVILPKGTNTSLEEKINLCDEESKILFARNKWLLCHEDNKRMIDRGAYVGLKGENIEIHL